MNSAIDVSPSEQDLELVGARDDRASRMRTVLVLFIVLITLVFLLAENTWTTRLIGLVVAAMGFFFAWRVGAVRRSLAMMRIGQFRRDGLAATKRLSEGDIDGAQRAYVALLRTARPLGAFHALHVLMYGVTRFLQGDTREALRLTVRTIDSGWLLLPQMRLHRHLAETWRVLMLLDVGETKAARERLQALGTLKLPTAQLALALFEEQWDDAIRMATSSLDDPKLPKAGRPTLAMFGLYAAKKLDRTDDVKAFEKVLEAEPLGPLAKRNPVVRRFS